MADEPNVQASVEPDKPETPEAPETDKPERETDWKSQYENLQPEFTRKSQQLAEYEQFLGALQERDPQALEALGWELAEEQGEDEYVDPVEDLESRLEQLESDRQQQNQYMQQSVQTQAVEAQLDEQFDRLEQQAGRPFNEKDNPDEFYAVLALARSNPTPQGVPDVEGAYKALEGLYGKQRESYLGSKRSTHAPSGAAATEVNQDLDSDDSRVRGRARRQFMAQRLHDLEE